MNRTRRVTCCLLLVVGCGKAVPPADEKTGVPVPQTVAQLRGQLNGEEINLRHLVRGWETVRPLCLEILRDPASKPRHVMTMFHLVKLVGGRDAEFLDLAFERMSDKDKYVRYAAVECLSVLGSERDAAPVVVLLLDEQGEVRNAAAKSLVAIGGKPEVLVFDLLLKNAELYHDKNGRRLLWDEYEVKHFQKCKAELEARLKKEAEAKEKK